MVTPDKISEHYCSPDLINRITSGLQKMGKSIDTVTIDDLASVDEFHLRGPKATLEIIELLQPQADSRLIDLGSGLGGPARRFAANIGCHVTGVDLSSDYCNTARELSKWLHLDSKTDFVEGSVTELAGSKDSSFDGAFSIHVAMNIRDRNAFYTHVARVLKTGARFVMYDVILGDKDTKVKYPQPWAVDVAESFLLTAVQMLAELEQAGFSIETTRDDSLQALEFLKTRVTKMHQRGSPPLSLATVLGPVVQQIMPNLIQNFIAGSLRLLAVSAIKQ
jgi:ubiquinone/menaquinone biosynthesis C-methylase UbiE